MSANISDVARIQDEDILRKMWQDTDDFGRKKEIRSHMYKLREARLKDFYNSADVNNTEIHRSTTTSTASKTNMSTTHADLLADQSYVTLKSKEVRDSESPTRDSYNKSIVKHQDQGWNINTSHEKSLDGKTHTSKHTATTSGTQKIDGGKLDYAAKLEEKSSVFQDGDDKNFIRGVGTSSSSAVRQEASGGDEHSNFRSSSSKTSSSSTYASESRHASEDIKALPATINQNNAKSISEKTYTTNIPHELKSHPNYIEGKTKVTQETQTLADGTVVTTTKYETKQGNSTETATHKKYSNIASSHTEQRTSSSKTHQESSRNIYNDSTMNRNDQRAIEYIVEPDVQDTRRFSNQQTTKTTQSEQTNRQSQQTTKTTQNEQVNRQNQRIVHEENVDYIPSEQNVTTKTTTTRNVVSRTPQEQTDISKHHRVTQDRAEYVEIPVDQFVKTTKTTVTDQVPSNTTYHTTSTHLINQKNDTKNDQFISTERQHEVETREAYQQQPKSSQEPVRRQPNEAPKSPQEPHVQPDRRQPIRPGKSELDQKPAPTDGQYDTTYRNDYTSKKISVEVSATHDAFARSLRSITPERITRGSPRTNSNASLRRDASPEKMRFPSRTSPERYGRSRSPKKAADKFSSTETITYSRQSPERYSSDIKTTHYSTDTFTRKSKNDSIDSSTLTRKKTTKPRSPSPTGTTTSDFEYIRSTKDVITDLDDVTVTRKDTTRPSSLDITTRKIKKVTERSPTSPLTDLRRSPTKDSPTPTNERPKLVRTDTYEERVKEILGLNKDTKETRRSSLEKSSIKRSSFRETSTRTSSSDDVTRRLSRSSPVKTPENQYPNRRSPVKEKSPEKQSQSRKSPTKSSPSVSELPAQIRRSPEKQPLEPYPERRSPTKTGPTISEFPAQTRKSPEKKPLEPYPERRSPTKSGPTISEFPAQNRKSPEKEPLEPYPERRSPTKTGPTISEFPAQTRKSPEREPLEPYPERRSPTKTGPTISEFPAQIRKSPEKEPLEPYPERRSPTKTGPTISEFPAQTRKSPEKEKLEPYPEKSSPTKTGPTISEFPSQIRTSPEREPLEPYPEKTSPTKTAPSISEFPSQIRKSPEKVVLEPYPERKSPTKSGPTICEFPSQVRKTPEREPLEPYPEKTSPSKDKPSLSEFPSQIRKSPEPLEQYPEKKSPGKNIPKSAEIKPSGISQPKKSPIHDEKLPKKEAPTIAEFPSQTRKSPEKKTPRKYAAGIAAVPSQIKPSSKDKKPRKDSESSTSETEDVEETITQKTVETVETRIPVEEPVLEKKIFSQLCKADEVRKIDHKKTTQELIESEILENEITKQQTTKIIKKDKPTQNGFLPKRPITKKLPEVTKTDSPTSKVPLKREPSKEKSPMKKTPSKKLIEVTAKLSPRIPTPKKQPQTIYKVEKTKFIGATEYQDEYSKISKLKKEPVKKPVKPTTKTTLYNIEQTSGTKEDKSIHIRTNRVDDTVTKKKVTKTIMLNGDAPKPKGKIPSPINKAPATKAPEVKPKQSTTTVTQSRYSTTVKKTVNEVKPKSKLIEPKKHTVTTRVTVAPTKKTITKKEYVSSDDEESVVESVEGSLIDLTNKDTDNRQTTKRVITTKTVLITNEPGPDREVIVNLQRSKSSREPTPDRLCPRPLTSDEEEDETPARYPDQISEPDEGSLKRKPKKLSDMPIFETETDFNENATRITEMSSRITKVDKVEESDESLLSINKKINKFLNTADQLTREPLKPKPGKVERPSLVVSEDLKEDECLLSVSDKVSKFISTAEQLTTDRSRSPKPKSFDVNVNIQQKVSDFNTSVEETQKPKTVAPKVSRPDLEDVEDDLKEDECLLSVSDKVSKFISTAEKLTTSTSTKPTVSLSKMEIHPTKDVTSEFIHTEKRQEISSRKSPERISFASPETTTPTKQRSPSPDYKTPDRKPSNEYASILKTGKVETDYYTSTSPESTPKSSRKVQDDSKSTTRLRSTESIKRAKALFENIGKDHDTPWQKDILSRPSVFDAKKSTKTTSRTDVEEQQEVIRRKSSTQKVDTVQFIKSQSPERPSSPGYTRFRPQSPEKEPESPKKAEYTRYKPEKESQSTKKPLERPTSPDYATVRPKSPEKEPKRTTSPEYTRSRPKSPEIKVRSREPTPEGELPHYMKPLDRSLRPNSPHRDSINQAKPQQHEPQPADQVDTRQTKFGVTLRRTDSGRTTKTTETSTSTTERRKSSITLEKRITEEEIEEIFEIEVLEELLEKVVGYELRRKIRTQIRLVKRLISEGTLESYIAKRRSAPREAISRRGSSPAKTVKPTSSTTSTTEYQTTYVRKDGPKRSPSPSKTVKSSSSTTSASEYQSTYVRKTSPEPRRSTSPAKTVTSVSTSTEYMRKPSPEPKPNEPRRDSSPAKTGKTTSSEYQTSYVRKTSPERRTIDNKLYQHTDIVDSKKTVEQSSSEYQSSYKSTKVTKNASPVRDRSSPQKSPERRVSKTVDLIPEGKVTTVKTTETIPGGTKTTTTKTTEKSFTTLKKTAPITKKPIEDSQPEWVRQRNLRNAKDSAAPVNKKVSSTTSTTTTKKSSILRTSPAKEVKGTDIITSSYGVGPTDENGTPLFGLKALRAQNKNEKIKVQGTVIRSEYYSENDQEPVGQVSVTKYSNDPRDLDQDGPVSSDGKVTSVTTTQKFGYKDTPSLRSLTNNKKQICDSSEKTSSTTTKTTKVNRRGSVKEMSKKFIDNAVETLKSERQTTYPKAGLILRSSSFKSTNGEGEPDSRELSPADDREAESSTVTVRTMKTTSSSSGETFLTNKSKISGVQDVITRMKNEEYGAEGDSEEDVAARGLLNKFLGAQVILSGMESHAASSNTKTTTSSSSPEGTVRRTTKITTTVTEGGKPTTTTRVFLRPVTEKELETVWDEQSLQVLLEQSTDYEERRIIRLKLRQVMAEQEACTALVDEATRGEEAKTPTTPPISGHLEEAVETTKEVKSEGDVTTTKVTTTKVTQQQQQVRSVPKPISPFAKFRQLDKQNSVNQPTPPSTPGTPRGSGPLFKFTDPALTQSASTIKDRLLHWCRMKTKEYENIQLDNFSSSWADGLAFCALIHHFLPEAFDYSILTPKDRKHNFELAFRIADEKADIFPLLDVEDMLETRRPDWKCVFTYVQSIYRRFKDED
ncbi:unnamed protein product [Ceutorhynchus assimilis]|uniref:Calponin-homology (CH) domain-containing protein n=1 Tax=Ceutorhynchus assimilis TaxID=467358 RepID=A0A9N9MZ73_9CUCU|nr:unnamed protein product [Ceutorhynchus assimilis]